MFIDRKDAGKKLSIELEKYQDEKPIILAVPRGGIVTAYESIKKFGFEWDLIIPRKIGSSHNKEFAIGAVTSDGTYFIDEKYVNMFNISQEYIEKEVYEQKNEIKRRLNKYKGNEDFPKVKDKTVIIIDDGIATGFTILAAIKSIKKHGAKRIILAVPVAPHDTVTYLEGVVDTVICLLIPDEFYAVGLHYENFEQTEDEEVITIINELK
ncbi:phosphoribosyltransferase [Tepidibacter aestuarii]|uniref:phosphoribosyltransferase n=1 Tax=Tepidibacter aestuarii TaxID=2925782 RepID=UPI0020BDEE5A|nr:phosphoribosyltransferase [Tepidibacter aestuarii]CAH2213010.1 putative phosphoribosyl transferase [Tepidibacter aestuarii]